MKVRIDFDMDNAEFAIWPEAAVEDVLKQVRKFLMDSTDTGHILRDINGNRIGQVTVEGYY